MDSTGPASHNGKDKGNKSGPSTEQSKGGPKYQEIYGSHSSIKQGIWYPPTNPSPPSTYSDTSSSKKTTGNNDYVKY